MKRYYSVFVGILLVVACASFVSAYQVKLYSVGVGKIVVSNNTTTGIYTLNVSLPYIVRGNFYVQLSGTAWVPPNSTVTITLVFDSGTVWFMITPNNNSWEVWSSAGDLGATTSLGGLRFEVDVHNGVTTKFDDIEDNVVKASGALSLTNSFSPSQLQKIEIKVEKGAEFNLNSISIGRFSQYISALSAVDENTLSPLHPDFVDISNGVKVMSATGGYAARDYYISSGALTAYLPPLQSGQYYTIDTSAQYANDTLSIYREEGGAWILVGQTKLDGSGQGSAFLENGVLYKFIINENGQFFEKTATTNPSIPIITLVGFDRINMANDVSSQFFWSITPWDGFLYYNVTNNITVRFSSEVSVKNITIDVNGAGMAVHVVKSLNATSGQFTVHVKPSQANTYAYATLTVHLSTGQTLRYTKSFYVKRKEINEGGILTSLRDATTTLGIGKVGLMVIAAIMSLVAAIALTNYAGDRAGVVGAIFVWMFFTYVKWIDWRITLIASLAGVGLLVRRGEV